MCTRNQALEILEKAYYMCNEALGGRVHDAYLYGSYARGDYHDESDIDILMTVEMTAEELIDYRSKVSKISSRLSLAYDYITVSITVKPLEQFQRYLNVLPYYGNVVNEGIRYAG